jgi:Uncharacterised nucleotidyltransferase
MGSPPLTRTPPALQDTLVQALRGRAPESDARPDDLDACLARHECGGYLHAQFRDHPGRLPEGWAAALARSHRKTLIDSLAAIATLREVETLLRSEGAPFILLKGGGYLVDLYDDPGARALTDVDLLVRPEDARRVARRLVRAGMVGEIGRHYPEDCRFEMHRPGPAPCRVEIHWRLGVEGRVQFDQEALWSGSREAALDGIPLRLLQRETAIVYHVWHAADHYFGPGLKWAIDLREMLRRWTPDPDGLRHLADKHRASTALHMALTQVGALFPQESPAELIRATSSGPLRGALLRAFRSKAPAEFFVVSPGDPARMLLRPLLLDSPAEVMGTALKVLGRPFRRFPGRTKGGPVMPWAADSSD